MFTTDAGKTAGAVAFLFLGVVLADLVTLFEFELTFEFAFALDFVGVLGVMTLSEYVVVVPLVVNIPAVGDDDDNDDVTETSFAYLSNCDLIWKNRTRAESLFFKPRREATRLKSTWDVCNEAL